MSHSSLGDYGLIGDGGTAALVSRNGSIDWLCLPDFSSPSLFAKLIDEGEGGFFSVTLDGITHADRHYIEGTPVLKTILSNADGRICITDCMPVRVNQRDVDDLRPLHEILRRIEVLEGSPEILVTIDARPDYAVRNAEFGDRGKLGWAFMYRQKILNIMSDFSFTQQNRVLSAKQRGEQGKILWLSLTFEENRPTVIQPLGDDAEERLALTTMGWKRWCARSTYQGPLREQVLRSAMTLRLLTFSVSGALLAAATTSLPERIGGAMNWDYRYCWPRDAALTLSAFMDCGFRDEADAFFGWLMSAANTSRPNIDVMYDIYGRNRLPERILKLAGYKNARPVRIGNQASDQMQHDVYGEIIMAVQGWIRHFGMPEADEQCLIANLGKALVPTWRKPDAGIWEIRGQNEHYTYSKIMAWYVFETLLGLHDKNGLVIDVERFRKERDALRQEIETHGFNKERGCFVSIFGGNEVDASLLLIPRTKFVDYDDPRMVNTWKAIHADLEKDGLILRYPPGFGGSEPGEGAFFICNFWAVDYLTGAERHDEAHQFLEKLLGLANDLGLYNEGIDPVTREMTGNLPQAYSHAALINSVMMLHAGRGTGWVDGNMGAV